MEDNKKMEKVYELVELYNFSELSDTDKQYVLSVLTENEYTAMRQTIGNVKLIFENDIEPEVILPESLFQPKVSKIKRIVTYPIKLYQVAASVAIIFTTFLLFQHLGKGHKDDMLAKNDTVFIHSIDTVYTKIYDTVQIIYKSAEYQPSRIAKLEKTNSPTQPTKKVDCKKELCPNEIEDITAMNGRNSISTDSTLKGILVSLN